MAGSRGFMGARNNTYPLGVVCAKVARYAERIEQPDWLSETTAPDEGMASLKSCTNLGKSHKFMPLCDQRVQPLLNNSATYPFVQSLRTGGREFKSPRSDQ
jgi:hypothetical protein